MLLIFGSSSPDATVTPSRVNAVATVGSSTVATSTHATVAAGRIACTTEFGSPTVSGTQSITVTPTSIRALTTVGSPVVEVLSTFQPPYVDKVPPVYVAPDPFYPVPALSQRLFRHYKNRAGGRSVLKINGTYVTVDYPTQDQIDSAEVVYLGGHVYRVHADEATDLIAAGFTTT